VRAPGEYTFYLDSDDGSRLCIDDKTVVDLDGVRAAGREKSGRIRLSAGKHPLTVTYFEKDGHEVLRVWWKGPGFEKRQIPPDVLYHLRDEEPKK